MLTPEEQLHIQKSAPRRDEGHFDYIDAKADNAVRHVEIVPLYAISQIGG